MKRIFIMLLIGLLGSGILKCQISIYPKVIFMDPISKSSFVKLNNETDEPREIEIFTLFGFTAYDSVGLPKMAENDAELQAFSLMPYLKIYPKRLVIPAKKQQTIRILASHPPDIADGTYFTRIIIRSRSIVKAKDTTNIEQIKTGMSFYSDVGTLVLYPKGKVNTNLEVAGIATDIDTSFVSMLLSVKKSGNSPFWGNAVWQIKDSGGNVVANLTEPVAFYSDAMRRFRFGKDRFKPGRYTAELVINTERKDVPPERLIKKEDIKKSYEFIVP